MKAVLGMKSQLIYRYHRLTQTHGSQHLPDFVEITQGGKLFLGSLEITGTT
jgi:hypothetical protein